MVECPQVSVIMTVYNAEQYVKLAIDSILNQTLHNIELVIVDDGSSDGTSKLLAEAKTDPRVRVISKDRIGRGRALNVAWSNARGLYIANLDADDLAFVGTSIREKAFKTPEELMAALKKEADARGTKSGAVVIETKELSKRGRG